MLVAVDAAALHAWRHGSSAGNKLAGSGTDGTVTDSADSQSTAQPAESASGGGAATESQRPPGVWPTLPQVDFAPTLAALLGLPIPYASIGRVSRGLWHLRGCGGGGGGGADACRQRYAATLQGNARQVRQNGNHTYMPNCFPE